MWKAINTVLPAPGKDNVVTTISPESFNEYFTTIGENVVSGNPTINDEYKWKLPDSIHTFKFSPINANEVINLLAALPNHSYNDIHGFDAKLLRITASIIAPSLTYIFNSSLRNSYFLNDWKLAKILPAYKGKGDIQEITNY